MHGGSDKTTVEMVRAEIQYGSRNLDYESLSRYEMRTSATGMDPIALLFRALVEGVGMSVRAT